MNAANVRQDTLQHTVDTYRKLTAAAAARYRFPVYIYTHRDRQTDRQTVVCYIKPYSQPASQQGSKAASKAAATELMPSTQRRLPASQHDRPN